MEQKRWLKIGGVVPLTNFSDNGEKEALQGRQGNTGGTRAPFSGFRRGGWTDGGLRLPLCEN